MNTHPYADNDTCIKRLLKEYDEHGSLVIAFDLDNTVLDYHKQGHDYSSVIKMINDCHQLDMYLICFTCAENTFQTIKFLKEHKIAFDAVNENPKFFKSSSRKIYYNWFLDDRAGLKSAMEVLDFVIRTIKSRDNGEKDRSNKV